MENPAQPESFLQLKARTPARIGVGRAGARYRTITQLRVRADHAAAQDSVFSDVPESFWQEHHWTFVQTMCKDKDEYLTRPDLGRRFDESQQAIIKKVCGTNPRVLIVIGDGLSSTAVMTNAPDCAAAIRQGLSTYGIEVGESLFIKYCRVGASDAIGQITGAELVCMLVGERPASQRPSPCPPISPTSRIPAFRRPNAPWSPTSTARARRLLKRARTLRNYSRPCWRKRPPASIFARRSCP